MDREQLQEYATASAEDLPGSELTYPFGDNCDVWKVRGKIFMLQTQIAGEPIVVLKATPCDAMALRQEHADISAGYHMNKKHWITIHPDGDVDADLLDELVTDSYLLVVERLPSAQQETLAHVPRRSLTKHQPVRGQEGCRAQGNPQ
ncbi:Uncharacterised protein YjbR [Propionibacterium ruminifibrarum]|uniref:Cytoplasmic protein n=1 Tax=Propionibacterium ruminifibrarum TaxID=1962131 RepID=A0A375I2H2_9ACTN|nr:MmcQ/YjbR family DNA-binding protein [Propionibacterium ruminifibrarum]SPF69059.1 Uncharacterised protein YjbR [Propionibacterium ruminifibrarum]